MEADRDEICRVLELSREHLRECLPLQKDQQSSAAAFEHMLYLARNGDQTRSAWRRVGVTASGRIVGGCAIYAMERGLTLEGTIHWWVSADALGQGFGTEIVRAAIQHGTADVPAGLGLHTISASIHSTNAASIALAQRVGFKRIGRARQPVLVGDRWERLDEYEFTVSMCDQGEVPGGVEGAGSAAGAASEGELVGVAVSTIPGRAWSVPSRATRS